MAQPSAYQRVGSQFDVTEAGVTSCSYLSFDGVDDFMVTGTITPGVDKATVAAGVRKLQDANVGILAEFGGSTSTVAGSFLIAAPGGPFPSYYAFAINRTAYFERKSTNTALAAPVSNVVSALLDFAQTGTGKIAFRANGSTEALTTVSGTDAGTGNFTAQILYIGRRGGSSLPFSGQIFSLVTRFAATDLATVAQLETWINGKTGAYS